VSSCDTIGTPFLTLTQPITEPDSGIAGNWANDALTENVKVWLATDQSGAFCASGTTTNGTFVTTGPLSPEHGVALASGITGTFTGGETWVFPTGTATTTASSSLTLPLDATTTGSQFNNWQSQVLSNTAGASTYSFTYAVAGDASDTWTNAGTRDLGDIITPVYTLTYIAGADGTITGTSTQPVDDGADGSAVTAVPNSGYQFSNWSDGSTANPRTDSDVTSSISVTANFTSIPVVSSGGGGGGGSAQANIGITSVVDNGGPVTGSTIHYTLTASATGPSASFGMVVNDVLPAGLTFVSASSSEGSYDGSTGVWTIGGLNVGQTATLTITATVTASTGTAITNTATVSESSAVVNSNVGNDSSSVTVNVGGTSVGQVLGASTTGTGGGQVGQVLGASTTNTAALLQELQNLEQQLIALEFKANSCSLTFNTNLSKGMTSSEVRNLQKVLNYTSLTQVAATGAGSPNNETTYFGNATKNAVIAFQNIFANQILAPNGLTSGNGYVGASTRSVLNGLCGQ
jgi:uncharacterized repeat protein (TIGR01451 family)